MQWSWKIGRWFGIDTRVHATFLLLLLWAAVSGFGHGGGALAAFMGVVFMIAVFASVFLHEVGHALTARVFGIGTHQILLTPLGGIAEIEARDMRPQQEMLIALAGPAVSLGLGGALLFVASAFGSLTPFSFIGALAWANLMIGLFNLLPAFPMDGGRVLRSWLATRMNYVRATGIAAEVGKWAALAMALFGLFYDPILIVLAAFVYLAGRAEARGVEARAAYEGVYDAGLIDEPVARDRWARPRDHLRDVYLDEGWRPRRFYRDPPQRQVVRGPRQVIIVERVSRW